MPTFHVVSSDSPVLVEASSSLHPVRAESRALAGTITVELDGSGRPDLSRPYAARLRIPVETIRSGHALQDLEMHRRLDTRRHPEITVDLTEVAATAAEGVYRAVARVAVRGRAQLLDGEVEVRVDGDRLSVEGRRPIDMRSFGVEPPRLLLLRVDPEVLVRVRIAAQRQA